jgi:hypothetical protein
MLRCVSPRAAPPQCRRSRPSAGTQWAAAGFVATTLGTDAGAALRRITLPPIIVDPAADASWHHRVHLFPLLKPAECDQVIELAEAHAAAQGGWRSDRHGKHPTVDIEVRRAQTLQDMLAPHLRLLEGFASAEATAGASGGTREEEVEFDDVFVVKYDHDSAGGQRSLGT